MSRHESMDYMDHETNLAVCKGIGERLRQSMSEQACTYPRHLQNLLDELVRRDRAGELDKDGSR